MGMTVGVSETGFDSPEAQDAVREMNEDARQDDALPADDLNPREPESVAAPVPVSRPGWGRIRRWRERMRDIGRPVD